MKNIEKNLIIKKFNYKINNNNYIIIIKDLNIFSELKTNLGLFNIKNFCNINFFFTGMNLNLFTKNYNYLLVSNLKL